MVDVCQMVGMVGAQGIPGLVLAHGLVRLGTGASAGPLVGRAGSWGLWLQGLGILQLESALW